MPRKLLVQTRAPAHRPAAPGQRLPCAGWAQGAQPLSRCCPLRGGGTGVSRVLLQPSAPVGPQSAALARCCSSRAVWEPWPSSLGARFVQPALGRSWSRGAQSARDRRLGPSGPRFGPVSCGKKPPSLRVRSCVRAGSFWVGPAGVECRAWGFAQEQSSWTSQGRWRQRPSQLFPAVSLAFSSCLFCCSPSLL